MRPDENVSKAALAPHIAGALAVLRPSEHAVKAASVADHSALSKRLSEILLTGITALAGAGEVEAACRLAGQACVALRRNEPGAARRFDALLHRLTPTLAQGRIAPARDSKPPPDEQASVVSQEQLIDLPGQELDVAKMPGHWLLARLGKRVLRPGGLNMTCALLAELAIGIDDSVVEFAPGLGVTACMILNKKPRCYVGVERDSKAAQWTARRLPEKPNISVAVGAADRSGLAAGSASVVLGEAVLTMQTQIHKEQIVAEALRLLRPGGRYGIHELAIMPDDMDPKQQSEISRALSATIHVGARPLPTSEWRALIENAGFRVRRIGYAPMHLLRPKRLIEDEGAIGALRIVKNVLLDGPARRRVLAMRRVFEQYRLNLGAVFIVAEKP